jgi:cobalt/nickel transport system permease protein
MFSIVLINDIITLIIGFLIAIALVYVSNIPLQFVLKRLRWVTLFVFAMSVVLIFTIPGKPVYTFGFLTISEEGVLRAFLIFLKAFSVILLIFPMLATMKFVTFIKALEKLRIPNKLVQIITLTYRYIFVFLNETQRTLRSVESRGYGRKMSLLNMRIIGNIIGMLLVRSYERGQHVYDAMVSRGYDGRIGSLRKFEMNSRDWLKAFMILAIAVLLHFVALITLFDLGVT